MKSVKTSKQSKSQNDIGIGKRFGLLILVVGFMFVAMGMGELTGFVSLNPNTPTGQFIGMGMMYSGIGMLIIVFAFLMLFSKFAW